MKFFIADWYKIDFWKEVIFQIQINFYLGLGPCVFIQNFVSLILGQINREGRWFWSKWFEFNPYALSKYLINPYLELRKSFNLMSTYLQIACYKMSDGVAMLSEKC